MEFTRTQPYSGTIQHSPENTPDHFQVADPAISVLLPVYNAEKYLRLAIDSILNQTFTDFELIAVNDGSTDRSLEILEEYAARDARVRVISRANTGIVGALNDALAAAQGEFIARMDGDDESLPARFAAQAKYLRSHADCVMVGTQVVLIDEDGDAIAPLKGIDTDHEQINHALLHAGWPIVHPTIMMRREALKAVGGYSEGTFPHEDHDLFLKLCEVGKLANLPEVMLRYRRHTQSISWDARSRGKMDEVMKAACARRGIPFTAPPESMLVIQSPRLMRNKLYRTWAWHALAAKNIRTARKYAIKAIATAPLKSECWKVLLCTFRGY